MKKITLLFVCLLAGTVVFAQKDPKAESILEKVSQTTQSFQTIQSDFSYKMDNQSADIHEDNKGTIILKKDKYKLGISTLGLEIFCDGKTVWTYMKDAEEVNIAGNDDDASQMTNPSKIFTLYKHGFDYKYVGDSVQNGTPVFKIDLIPNSSSSIDYKHILVSIDKNKHLIKKAVMYGKDGNIYTIEVTNLKTNVDAPDSLFVFDPATHPGVHQNDLR